MKIRAIANGNEYEYDDERARELVATGLFEEVKEIDKDFAPKRKTKTT